MERAVADQPSCSGFDTPAHLCCKYLNFFLWWGALSALNSALPFGACCDFSGNVSALSNEICVDNCPNFLLPNIITPNGDECNEVFNAYSVASPTCNPGQLSSPRYVMEVNFRVFDRWGIRVYESNWIAGEEREHPVYWEGNDAEGRPVASGAYYYEAQVMFDVLEPESKIEIFKGWVHVLR